MDKQYKQLKSVGFFEQEYTLDKLKALGNPLEILSSVIDFEIFRDLLKLIYIMSGDIARPVPVLSM